MVESGRARAIAGTPLIWRGFLKLLARNAAVRDCQETFKKYPQKSAIPTGAAPSAQLPLKLPGFGFPPQVAGTWLGAASLYTRNVGGLPLIGNVGLVARLRMLSVVPYWPHG